MSVEFPDDVNPYAAPTPAPPVIRPPIESGMWRDGRTLVAAKGVAFPDRCVKCNAPAEGYRLKRALSWHHPAFYLIIFFNLIVYIIIALIVRETATFYVGLCGKHRRVRRNAITTAWVLIVASVGLCVMALVQETPWPALVALALVPCAAIYGIVRSQIIRPKRIDKNYAWIGGASPEFLARLEEVS